MRASQRLTAWLHRDAAAAMVAESHRRAPSETGGVLVGYWPTDEGHVVITNASGPGPAAIHAASRFTPDTAWQQAFVDAHYTASDGLETYLGDWHVHPAGSGSLSRLDRRTLRGIARDHEARAPVALMAIVHGDDLSDVNLWCWWQRSPWYGLWLRRRRVRRMSPRLWS